MSDAGATCPVQSIKACVVYDSANGRIHHVHRVLTLVGGREPSEDEIAADALRAMGSLPEPPTRVLEVLHVHHSAVESGKRYRVDLTTKALVVHG
jgi:flavin-binding protein dodecin